MSIMKIDRVEEVTIDEVLVLSKQYLSKGHKIIVTPSLHEGTFNIKIEPMYELEFAVTEVYSK